MPEGGEDQEIDWEATGRKEAASEVDDNDKNAETANEEKDLLVFIRKTRFFIELL